jgi:hypothetical protein
MADPGLARLMGAVQTYGPWEERFKTRRRNKKSVQRDLHLESGAFYEQDMDRWGYMTRKTKPLGRSKRRRSKRLGQSALPPNRRTT